MLYFSELVAPVSIGLDSLFDLKSNADGNLKQIVTCAEREAAAHLVFGRF